MLTMKDRIPVCPHGSRENIDLSLVAALEMLERKSGLELEFSSGYRCKACNAAAGGVKNSAHLRGFAVDIIAGNSAERYLILHNAISMDFRRIGIAKTFIHLDVDTKLNQDVLWLY